MQTHELVDEVLNRIDDYLHDPEPVYDEMMERLPPHLRQQLWFACKSAQEFYKKDQGKCLSESC